MKKLLWIDDDEKLIDSSMPVFLKNGFYVFKATNTSRALTILREEAIDGVLLDVRLYGDENGLELLDELRHRYPTVRVAVFTGYPGYDDHVRAERSGALVYLEKIEKSIPLDPDKQREFFDALNQVFPERPVSPPPAVAPQAAPSVGSSTLWIDGLYFLLMFAVIITGVAVLSQVVSTWVLPVALIASALLYTVIGAFILRTQGGRGLSQKNFLTLTLEALRLLPVLRKKSNEQNLNSRSREDKNSSERES